MRIRSVFTHSIQALAEAALISILVVGLIAGVAFAGKGGTGKPSRGGGSLSPVVLDGGDATANHGERLTFTVVTTATDRPFVGLKCWQGSTGVYNSTIGIFPTYMFDPWFTLDSSYWTAGIEATCTARLYYYDKRGNQRELATLGVTVAP